MIKEQFNSANPIKIIRQIPNRSNYLKEVLEKSFRGWVRLWLFVMLA